MTEGRPEVLLVHKLLRKAYLSDDSSVPVTHWFGRDGNECDPMVAVSCVCGDDVIGWFAIDLEAFGPAQVH